ncbi:MAG: hypothetical protein HQ541_03785 [Mariniphaga sp.]|nr:hypothetical protein [Mariniphaga sp.]
MFILSAKTAKILHSNSIEEKSILSYVKKGGLFSSKTHFILTKKNFYILKEKNLISERNYLTEGESFVFLTNKFELLTDKRLIFLKYDGHNLILSNEIHFLDRGERYSAFLLATGLDGQHITDFESNIQTELALNVKFNILTNKSIKIFKGAPNFELLNKIDLSNTKSINLTREELFIRDYCCITFWLKDGKSRCITHGDLSNVAQTEDFPKTICQEANVPFAKPYINHSDSNKILIELYPKIGLKWPSKCANCLTEDSNFEYRVLYIEKDIFPTERVGNSVGFNSFLFNIPYCSNCNSMIFSKAVKKYGLNGVNAILEFNNEKYAQEFIEINS